MRRVVLALALACCAVPALACSCIRIAPEGFRRQADVILYGRVLKVDTSRVPGGGPVAATIRVLHPVKGHTPREIRVLTAPHSAACGVEMTPGKGAEFLLMRKRGHFSTNLCLMLGSSTR